MSSSAAEPPGESPFAFPGDVLATILLRLGHRDIINFAATCKALREAVEDDDKLWLPLCHAVWGPHTQVERWLSPAGPSSSAAAAAAAAAEEREGPAPETYK
jgi:hypothetical protein